MINQIVGRLNTRLVHQTVLILPESSIARAVAAYLNVADIQEITLTLCAISAMHAGSVGGLLRMLYNAVTSTRDFNRVYWVDG